MTASEPTLVTDDVHARLVVAVEKPERAHLWTPRDAITFVPRVLPKVYGDGRALFTLSTINQRPAYWIIRACSTWSTDLDLHETKGPSIREKVDDILTDLEETFGNGRCGYSSCSLFQARRHRVKNCKCEDCDSKFLAQWPMVDGYGGCAWSRMEWPAGFQTEDSGRFILVQA